MKLEVVNAADEVTRWTEVFSSYQNSDGSSASSDNEPNADLIALEQIEQAYSELCHEIGGLALNSLRCFELDIDAWHQTGLDNAPDFRATHSAWRTPDKNQSAPFIGPIRIPNGIRGGSFILNFALLEDLPLKHLDILEQTTTAVKIPPKDVPVLEAPHRSLGYSGGDGSVLFSELMSSSNRQGEQTFGAFIVTDFPRRFNQATKNLHIPYGSDIIDILKIGSEDDLKQERATWLLIHDRFHELGNLPHSQNLNSKMYFSAAILDELKADGSAYLSLRQVDDNWSNVGLRQIIDKMFRFPFSPYAYMSVDGAVGELLLRQAIKDQAIFMSKGRLNFSYTALDDCISRLVNDSIELESSVDNLEQYKDYTARYVKSKGVVLPPDRKPLCWPIEIN